MGPVLICSSSKSGHDVVVQVAQVHFGVGAEWRQTWWSGGGWGWRQPEVIREGEGRLYHDKYNLLKYMSQMYKPGLVK